MLGKIFRPKKFDKPLRLLSPKYRQRRIIEKTAAIFKTIGGKLSFDNYSEGLRSRNII